MRDQLDWYLKQVRSYPALSRERKTELATRWRRDGDRRAGERLLNANLRTVIPIARRYLRSGEPFDDLVGEGNLGIVHALQKYDPDKETRFATYASFWIRTYLTRYVRRTRSMVSSSVHDQALLYTKIRRERSRITVTETDELEVRKQLSETFGVTAEEIQQLEARFSSRDASLDTPIDEGMGVMMRDTLVASTPDPAQLAAFGEVMSLLEQAMEAAELDERELVVVQQRLLTPPGDEPSLAEIGRQLDVTREWARQLERRAMKKLGEHLDGGLKETLRAM
ncbi:MAG: sigma-70 family RNA polymerase sigma factor [Myxococcota bacterium]